MSDFQQIEHRGSLIQVARENATWLGVIDIAQHVPIELTIKRVFEYRGAKFEKGRTQDGQAIEFVGASKYLPLNKTNVKRLHEHYGSTAEELAGQVIVLDVEPLDRVFNGHTHGIRIKPKGGS